MGLIWGPPGSCRPQVGLMLAPWTLLSGVACLNVCHMSSLLPVLLPDNVLYNILRWMSAIFCLICLEISISANQGYISLVTEEKVVLKYPVLNYSCCRWRYSDTLYAASQYKISFYFINESLISVLEIQKFAIWNWMAPKEQGLTPYPMQCACLYCALF